MQEKKTGGIESTVVIDDNPRLGWEGSHMLHLGEWYYVFCIHWAPEEMRAMGCFRARTPAGPWEGGKFMELDLDGRGAGVAQGGPVQLHDGSWALFLFQDHGAVGRIPVVVPFRWEDGWPVVDEVPKQLNLPTSRPDYEYAPLYTSDDLSNGWSVLWQWNHEPHPELTELSGGLSITTDRLASDCTEAINTLTQRCFGPACEAGVCVHPEDLNIGDHAGICALMGCFAQLAVARSGEGLCLVHLRREAATGEVIASEPVPLPGNAQAVQLEARFDFTEDTAAFRARVPGGEWVSCGPSHQLVYRLDHFMGCRVGLFIHATQESGGTARFTDFVCAVEEG